MTKIIQRIFLLFILLNIIMPQVAYAAPPTRYNQELSSDTALRGAIFAEDASNLYAEVCGDNFCISSPVHRENVVLKFKVTALNARMKHYNGFNVGVTHIADDGTITHTIKQLRPDSQGFAYAAFDFSETIISGLTGTTTFSETGLSGNYTKTFNEVNVSYIDFNITNHDSNSWSSTDGRNYKNKSVITINGSMVTNESNIPLQLFLNLEGVNGTGDIGIAYTNLTAIPREIESVSDDNVSLYFSFDTGANSEFVVLWGSDNNTEPDADSTYGSHAVWDSYFKAVYHLNQEPSGAGASTILDSTSNAKHGTQNGFTVDSLVDAEYGKGVHFDGSNDYITLPQLYSSLSEVTTTIKYKSDVVNTAEQRLFLYGGDGSHLITSVNAGTDNLIRSYANAWSSTTTAYSVTDWHTISSQAEDGVSLYTFVDGVRIGTNVVPTFSSVATDHIIGAGATVPTEPSDGIIAEVRVSTLKRPDNWIGTEHNNLNNPTAIGPLAFYASFGSPQFLPTYFNITTAVIGDTTTTNYTTSIPQTHTLTPTANISEIVFNTTSTDWDYIAVLYWTNDIISTETATNGEYHSNITAIVPLNLDNGTLNYTITNNTLLDADFSNYIQLSTNDSNFNESESNLTLPDISLHTTATIGTYYYDLQYDYFYPPQNLTADPAITSVALNWTQTPNADNYSIYELEEGIPWFDTPPTLDGIIDSIYNTTSHHFHILTPNDVNPNDFDFFFMGRDAVWVYLAGTAIDDDAVAVDDYARLYIDFSKDGLTSDDRMYEIRENGVTKRYAWSGSNWAISPGSGVGGVTVGAGTNLITYELRVPVSELPASWVTGLETKMLLERECTSLQPDVQSFYPYGNINNTDTSIWQDIKLTNESEYAFIANTTNTDYIDQDLTPFNWYRYAVSAWNQTNETSFSIVNVTTLDFPTYNISGYILDNSTGFGIPNAVVWAENGLVSHRETTNASGYYNHAGFHNGTYVIFANATDYDENSTAPFTISGANITNKNVTLIYNPFIPTAVDVNDYAYSIVIPYYISNESLRLAPLKLENATVFTMYPGGNVTYDVSYSTSTEYLNNSTGIVRMYSDDQFALYHNSSGQTVFIKSHINPTSTDSDMNPSLMPYQIYMMLISIVILLIYFTFTVSDPEYYTDIITALFAMLISAIVAHNSIMGVLIMYPLQTEVQYDIYASAPLGIVFALVSLLMLLIFVTKILDLGHRETDSL